jgi:hypothetical protein
MLMGYTDEHTAHPGPNYAFLIFDLRYLCGRLYRKGEQYKMENLLIVNQIINHIKY